MRYLIIALLILMLGCCSFRGGVKVKYYDSNIEKCCEECKCLECVDIRGIR